MLLMSRFKKTLEIPCGMQTAKPPLRYRGVTSPVTPPPGYAPYGVSYWLVLARELMFTKP